MVKKGDTLIEVTLAVGIFSMVAVAIVAVLNGSISGAQSSLEATLTREEIDAQAEALRFVQSAYISDHSSSDERSSDTSVYTQLWRKITAQANDPSDAVTIYAPSSCQELYAESGDVFAHRGFVINTRALGTNPSGSLVLATDNATRFTQSLTYPHLIYGDEASSLASSGANADLLSANGLYVVAVRDNIQTSVVGEDGNITKTPAFFDFYIRACWYGTDADEPSTISTVIRLYDPDAIQSSAQGDGDPKGKINLNYFVYDNDTETYNFSRTGTVQLKTPQEIIRGFTKKGYIFAGYCSVPVAQGDQCTGGVKYEPSAILTNNDPDSILTIDLYPIWEHVIYTIQYNPNFGSWNDSSQSAKEQKCDAAEDHCYLIYGGDGANDWPKRTNYKFLGWCNGAVAGTTCYGTTYQNGNDIMSSLSYSKRTYTLTAIWRKKISYTITYNLNNGSWLGGSTDNKTATCTEDQLLAGQCVVISDSPTRSGYGYSGWCLGTVNTSDGSCNGTEYSAGQNLYNGVLQDANITLTARWYERNETITVNLTFGYSDCDSHVQGQKSDNSYFHAYFGNKIGSDLSGLTIAQLNYDYTSGGTETFTINTLGGRNYYYYVHNWSGCDLYSSGTYVTVSGQTFSPITYYSSNASGSGSYWNVFAYKNGQIVSKQTRSNSPEVNY